MKKHNIQTIRDRKGGKALTMLTAYDFQTAKILDGCGVDILLIGDSIGNVIYGYKDTLKVTVEDILRHTKAVVSAVEQALVVADMPFLSYQVSEEKALENAGTFIALGGADAIKLEGASFLLPRIRKMVDIGIPVMGHLGFTPQSYLTIGGFKKQGKNQKEAQRILDDALALEQAGIFSLVLECIPDELAMEITTKLHLPTIGIGSGQGTDGQVLVINDLLGLATYRIPSFVGYTNNLKGEIEKMVHRFIDDVQKP